MGKMFAQKKRIITSAELRMPMAKRKKNPSPEKKQVGHPRQVPWEEGRLLWEGSTMSVGEKESQPPSLMMGEPLVLAGKLTRRPSPQEGLSGGRKGAPPVAEEIVLEPRGRKLLVILHPREGVFRRRDTRRRKEKTAQGEGRKNSLSLWITGKPYTTNNSEGLPQAERQKAAWWCRGEKASARRGELHRPIKGRKGGTMASLFYEKRKKKSRSTRRRGERLSL